MKCVHYEIWKNGNKVYEGFGWYDENTDVEKMLRRQWKNCKVVIK